MKKYILITLLAASLSGCIGVPNIKENTINTIIQNNRPNNQTLFSSNLWWQNSKDDNLNTLINEILSNNSQIKIAKLNIDKANSSLLMAKRANLSSFDLSASGSRSHILKNHISTQLPIRDFKNSNNLNKGNIALQGGYTLDLWGKFKALEKQGEYIKLANVLQSRWVSLNISVSVADIYGKYILLTKEEDIVNKKLQIANKIYNLQKFSYKTGLTDEQSLLTAENNSREIKSALATIKINKHIIKNSLNNLNGSIESPIINSVFNNIDNDHNLKFHNLINTPNYIDSDIVINRPDIQYYLSIIKSQKEKLKSIKADFYPRFSILGNIEYQALNIEHLIDANSTILNFGPSLYLPLFNRNTLKQNYKIAGTDLNIFIENYNSHIIEAYQTINNNLMTLKLANNTNELNNKNFINSNQIYKNNNILFDLGNISKMNLLISKNNFLDAQLKDIKSKYNLYQNQINLINSLGGYYKNEVK
ncbi:TolC family protein [uncultured Cetobacterium sp.]|uniref:TolC family protein n=1 Tax=uncultured Cetobacterium sp. TaxID=527638 RepID=UPI00261AB9C4|nr:TolC family protein [uncultured Cetobacterium sp.]